jgi:hypothetical protein
MLKDILEQDENNKIDKEFEYKTVIIAHSAMSNK